MSVEDIKAKGLKVWYVKAKKAGKYISTKYDGNYEFVDEPHMFCMSLDCLRNYLTKPHRTIYSKDSKLNVNIISPLDINDIEIVCK